MIQTFQQKIFINRLRLKIFRFQLEKSLIGRDIRKRRKNNDKLVYVNYTVSKTEYCHILMDYMTTSQKDLAKYLDKVP